MERSFVRSVSGSILARNAGLNLVGLAIPLLAALGTIPLLIRGLGDERFGFLAIAWILIGYFGLFDLGLGRALTKEVAERIGENRRGEIPALAWTALLLMAALGGVGALLLAGLTPWLVSDALRISAEMVAEAADSLYLLALSLPLVITTAGLRGLLEANQSFGAVNALRIPMGLFNYLGPLLVLPFSQNLVPVIATLVVGRFIATGAHVAVCLRIFPELRSRITIDASLIPDLMRLGGWMTVSNIISPLMTYVDRFLIGALISMSVVAYYVTPYEVVTKLLLIPSALAGVLFPAVASSFTRSGRQTAVLVDRAVRAVFLILFPVTLIIVALAREGLMLWIPEYADQSTLVLQWLAVGVFINSLAYIPATSLHAIGRPDITGKLHLAELPIYIAAIWALAEAHGIVGIAIAWVMRVALDAILLFAMAQKLLPGSVADLRGSAVLITAALISFGVATMDAGIVTKAACLVGFLGLFALFGWYRILEPGERALVHR